MIPAASVAPLGIVTKTSSPFDFKGVFSPCTGEITTPDKSYSSSDARSNRWALKSVVNTFLPKSRTAKCMRWRIPDSTASVSPGSSRPLAPIQLCKSKTHGKAFYNGLMACGSVWTCPVCAAKISERRRVELSDGMEAARIRNFKTHFVTLTFPHGAGDDLQDIRTKMSAAYGRLSNGKYSVKGTLKKIDSENEIFGFIRAVEVTHGKNGFHPHIHMIVFTNDYVGSSALETVYSKSWKNACRLAGLPEPNEYGCVVKDGAFASDYISKWGIEDEMTKANAKTSSNKGVTPWGLLKACLDGDVDGYPPERAEMLFKIYAKSFHGQRQLYWSNGLRKLLDLSKLVTDQEIAERVEDDGFLLSEITSDEWKAIRYAKAEPILLAVAESNGLAVKPYIKNLLDSYKLKTVGEKPIPSKLE